MPKKTAPKPLRLVVSPAGARAARDSIFAEGVLTMRGAGGQTWKITVDDVREWHEIEYSSKGEPPLEPGELSEILFNDVSFGHLVRRADGLWESELPYFAQGVPE